MITTQQKKEELYSIVDRLVDKGLLGGGLIRAEREELATAQNELESIRLLESVEEAKKAKETKKRIRKVNKRFKRDEDWVNEQLGLKREGHMKRGIACADGVSDMFSVDVTRTKEKLVFIRKEMADAKAHATNTRTPIVVIFQDDYERKHGIVAMEFQDFKDLHGK